MNACTAHIAGMLLLYGCVNTASSRDYSFALPDRKILIEQVVETWKKQNPDNGTAVDEVRTKAGSMLDVLTKNYGDTTHSRSVEDQLESAVTFFAKYNTVEALGLGLHSKSHDVACISAEALEESLGQVPINRLPFPIALIAQYLATVNDIVVEGDKIIVADGESAVIRQRTMLHCRNALRTAMKRFAAVGEIEVDRLGPVFDENAVRKNDD